LPEISEGLIINHEELAVAGLAGERPLRDGFDYLCLNYMCLTFHLLGPVIY